MSIFNEQFLYVSIIVYVAGSLGMMVTMIPGKVYSYETFPLPVTCYLVVIFQDLEEM